MNPRVKKVQCEGASNLIVTFENGETKLFDMSPYLSYPVFNPLKEQDLFNKAHVQYGTVVWNNEIDIDPDTLYIESKPLKEKYKI